MRASLDTNIILHIYRAKKQDILFSVFDDGCCLHEFLYQIELANHGADIIESVNRDIQAGLIKVYSDSDLTRAGISSLFRTTFNEYKLLYLSQDVGEVYAMSLAITLGISALVTDDIKLGGPYRTLLQETDYHQGVARPFNFADMIILEYLFCGVSAEKARADFDAINSASEMNWSLKSHIRRFVRRFFDAEYSTLDKEWLESMTKKLGADSDKMIEELFAVC